MQHHLYATPTPCVTPNLCAFSFAVFYCYSPMHFRVVNFYMRSWKCACRFDADGPNEKLCIIWMIRTKYVRIWLKEKCLRIETPICHKDIQGERTPTLYTYFPRSLSSRTVSQSIRCSCKSTHNNLYNGGLGPGWGVDGQRGRHHGVIIFGDHPTPR